MTRQIVEYHASIERIIYRKPSDCVIEKTNQSFQSSRTYDRLSLCLRRRSVGRNTRTSGPSLDSCESVRESHSAYLLFVVGRFSYGIVMSRLLIFRSKIIFNRPRDNDHIQYLYIYKDGSTCRSILFLRDIRLIFIDEKHDLWPSMYMRKRNGPFAKTFYRFGCGFWGSDSDKWRSRFSLLMPFGAINCAISI